MSLTRRDFLSKMGIGAFLIAASSWVAAITRMLQPNLTSPAAGPVEIGAAEEYKVGTLTFVENARAYVGRDAGGIYAILAVCTHLGCTPRLKADAFVCPCHGSRFSPEGQVVSGPATRPLDRAFVGRAANGKLVVDCSRVVDSEFRLLA